MTRTLYFRIVLTFIGIVILSCIVSFFVSGQLFKREATAQMLDDMLQSGQTMIQLLKEPDLKKPELYLIRMANQSNYAVTIYNTNGEVRKYDTLPRDNIRPIPNQTIQEVLSGEIYYSANQLMPVAPDQAYVGLPYEQDGKKYALFIQPNFEVRNKQLYLLPITVISIIIGIGSIMTFLLSRFIVNPITKLAEATLEMSTGNFNVQVPIRRSDELGLLAQSFNHMAGELRQLEQMRQDFISNVSHEIQSPLTSIRGFSEALKEPAMNHKERLHYLEIIETESERLSRMVDNLLRLTSLESGQQPNPAELFDLDEELRKVVIVNHLLLMQKEIEYDLFLPKTKIIGNKDQLFQIWTNLIHNSIKYTPKGGYMYIKIKKDGNYVRIRFTDTGVGIPPEDQAHIFERFYKVDKSRDRSVGGNGLGLAIVKKIVEIHQGKIELESEVGKGTTVTILLPSSNAS
ncbi:HAMP domain-containing sensor histidine kinase [Paenibacillus rigui]|uniref:Heme sensor protein HssS n=1 Tax=Paenibacillus rigui TaxID=554312 RepID=A0A229ULC6_9BACL|nr:HAMP domain-containing sensor histidine kinase [Paenibacillus rigui]OXM84220.1 two-component sensor histidine kinase [Paenibacillus rigui]